MTISFFDTGTDPVQFFQNHFTPKPPIRRKQPRGAGAGGEERMTAGLCPATRCDMAAGKTLPLAQRVGIVSDNHFFVYAFYRRKTMISILHLSDLRIAQSGQWNNLRSCILEQARRVRSRPRGEKLLVLTGDFRNFEDSDYSKAETFLTQLFAAMDIDPATGVFVVPGNHDVGNDVLMEQCFPGDKSWKRRQRSAVEYLKKNNLNP